MNKQGKEIMNQIKKSFKFMMKKKGPKEEAKQKSKQEQLASPGVQHELAACHSLE